MAQEGIATLPQAPENQVSGIPDLEAIKQSIGEKMPGSMDQYGPAMDELVANLNLPPDQLQLMQQILQYILTHEQEYPQIRQQLIQEGQVSPEDLPEQFDRGYLSTMMVVVQEALKKAGGAMPMAQGPEAQGFAKGGLAAAAQSLAAKGRGGDTILAHINPEEAMMLRAMGGSGTINPATGLMEFKGGGIGGFVSGIGGAIGGAFKSVGSAIGGAFKGVANAVKSIASSPIGKIVMTVGLGMAIAAFPPIAALGPIASGAIAGALSTGAVSLAGGSNLTDSLRSAAIGGAMGGIAGGVTDFVQPSGWLQKGMLGAGLGTGYGLATGQSLPQALKTGALAGLTSGAVSGFQGDTMSANANAPAGAPVTDKSTPWSPEAAASPTTPTTSEQAAAITSQGGALLPTSEGISTLPTGATNLQSPVTPTPSAPQYPDGLSYDPGAGYGTATTGMPTTRQLADTTGFTEMAGYTGSNAPAASAPASKGISDYLQQGKDYLFGTDPANPGLFMSKDGGYSVPAITAGVLGVGALTGGFNQSTPESTSPGLVEREPDGSPTTGTDLVNRDPSKYVVGGIPGFNSPVPPVAQANYVPTPAYGSPNYNYPTYTPPPGTSTNQPGKNIAQPYNTADMYNFYPKYFAAGGISQAYPRRTGGISGPGTGTSDDIPAMLSDGEFVITAKAVRGAGNGSRREGAKKLYRMMHALEKKAKK